MATYYYDTKITTAKAYYDGRYLYGTVEIIGQDWAGLRTQVRMTIYSEGGNKQYYGLARKCNFAVFKSGQTFADGTYQYWTHWNAYGTTDFPLAAGTKSYDFWIPHNADGTMSVTLEYNFALSDHSDAYCNVRGTQVTQTQETWVLPVLKKDVRITSAPNFTDEETPVIEFVNDPSDGTQSLVLSLLSEDKNTTFATRTLKATDTSHTLVLTAAEKQAIYNYVPNASTCVITFRLVSKVSDTKSFDNELVKTFTITPASPVVTATVTKTSDDEGSLTGSADVLILYRSDVSYTMSATAKKGATIKSLKAACGSKSFSTTTGAFTDVESGTFVFTAVDSRGNVGTYTVERQYVDYTSLTCNLEIDAPRTDGTLDFTILGSYFPNSFGAVGNTLKVEYRYSVNEGEYTDWIAVTPTISGKSYYAVVSLEGLNYLNMYRFQGRATDRLQVAESGAYAIKTRPVFDWSENDFNFNCPVTITDGYLKYPLMGVINAMTKTYVCDVTVFDGANYSVTAAGATICGNILRCNFTATRNSASGSGNITNETVCTLSIAHGGKINNMLNVCFGNGANGHVASFLTNNVSYTAETLDFNVVLSATAGATNEFSTYFQVPISINLDKFVEEVY